MKRYALALLFLALAVTMPAFARSHKNTCDTPMGTCENVNATKSVSFTMFDSTGKNLGEPSWVNKWEEKNARKHPMIMFSDGAQKHYDVVITRGSSQLQGLEVVYVTTTTPVSGNGTIVTTNGGVWTYSYTGTVTTTSPTVAPYTITNNFLCATAYDDSGKYISQRCHMYSFEQGGAPGESLGYNTVGALAAINARGRMLKAIVKDIEQQ
jgi:hypothetical protein